MRGRGRGRGRGGGFLAVLREGRGRREGGRAAEGERRAVFAGDADGGDAVADAPDAHRRGEGARGGFLEDAAPDLALDPPLEVQSLGGFVGILGFVLPARGFGGDVRDRGGERGVLAVAKHVERAGEVEERGARPRHLGVQPEEAIRAVHERAVVLAQLTKHVAAQDGDLRATLHGGPFREHRQANQALTQVVQVARELALAIRLGLPGERGGERLKIVVSRPDHALHELPEPHRRGVTREAFHGRRDLRRVRHSATRRALECPRGGARGQVFQTDSGRAGGNWVKSRTGGI